jgi:hypothetical protein
MVLENLDFVGTKACSRSFQNICSSASFHICFQMSESFFSQSNFVIEKFSNGFFGFIISCRPKPPVVMMRSPSSKAEEWSF